MQELFFHEKRSQSRRLCIEGYNLQRVHGAPNIYVIEDFLTAIDLEYLDSQIEGGQFRRSYVDQTQREDAKSLYDAGHRSSTFISFTKQQDSRIAAIEQKAARLLGCYSSEFVEPLQLVRYLPGQFFGPHHDMADLQADGRVVMPPKSFFVKRRIVTVFCYLNEVDQGGATWFPYCDRLRVQPVRGRAVLFSNVMADGSPDARTVHAGEAVEEGVKYGLNIWLCEG
jgi:prolyl 4-hydroxylase